MKDLKKIFVVLTVFMFFLTGCNGKKEDLPQEQDATIEEAQKRTAVLNASAIKMQAETYYFSILVSDSTEFAETKITFDNGVINVTPKNNVNFEIDSTIPNAGYIIISKDGKVSGSIEINGYKCQIDDTTEPNCIKK